MNQHSYDGGQLSMRNARILWLCAALSFLFGTTGCLSTRNTMYLNKKRAAAYLASLDQTAPSDKKDPKAKDPKAKDPKAKDPKAKDPDSESDASLVLNAKQRQLVAEVPDARKILGGYCNKPEIEAEISKMAAMTKTCQDRTDVLRYSSNLNGALFWGFLGGTVVSGAGMIAGGILPEDKGLAAGLAVGFGSAALLFSVINGFGGFDARQEISKMRATRLDNYMWTMRSRIVSEICNAPSEAVALRRVRGVRVRLSRYCSGKDSDDGIYRP